MENFIYLIHDHATDRAAVVDPAWDVPEVLALADRTLALRSGRPDAELWARGWRLDALLARREAGTTLVFGHDPDQWGDAPVLPTARA